MDLRSFKKNQVNDTFVLPLLSGNHCQGFTLLFQNILPLLISTTLRCGMLFYREREKKDGKCAQIFSCKPHLKKLVAMVTFLQDILSWPVIFPFSNGYGGWPVSLTLDKHLCNSRAAKWCYAGTVLLKYDEMSFSFIFKSWHLPFKIYLSILNHLYSSVVLQVWFRDCHGSRKVSQWVSDF